MTGKASYLTEPCARGTLLTSRMEFQTSGPARIIEPLLSRIIDRDSRRDELLLKAMLEHGGALQPD